MNLFVIDYYRLILFSKLKFLIIPKSLFSRRQKQRDNRWVFKLEDSRKKKSLDLPFLLRFYLEHLIVAKTITCLAYYTYNIRLSITTAKNVINIRKK